MCVRNVLGTGMTEPAKDEALERMNETLKKMHKKSPRPHGLSAKSGRVVSNGKERRATSKKLEESRQG